MTTKRRFVMMMSLLLSANVAWGAFSFDKGQGLLTALASEKSQQESPAVQLLKQFKQAKVFYQQLEVAKKIVALHDASVLQELTSYLDVEDRHIRGNAAFIFAGLGDERGFEVINAILMDKSERPEGQGIAVASSDGRYHAAQQIKADRYYAVHLLGALKDARTVPLLIPFLHDKDVNYNVVWALGESGDRSAIPPLIDALDDSSSDVRVIAIQSLEKLGAQESLPRLLELLSDNEKSHFGQLISVAEAAQAAITKLQAH